jgi:hypothetical protein
MLIAEAWRPGFVGDGQVRYYSLARHALIEALRLVGVRSGSRILLPEYICRDMLSPLHLLGAVPCWYAVASDFTPATKSSDWPLADVVLAVNYFGFPQNLAPFQLYAERTGAVVIEDNAHGYLSCDQMGQWLGCRTGLGIFSLRKTFRIPDGAALWVGAQYTNRKLPAQVEFDGVGFNLMQLRKSRLRGLPGFGEIAYRIFTSLSRALRKLQKRANIFTLDLASEKILPVIANPWVKLLPTIANYSESAEIERRRSAYINWKEFGERVGAVPVFSSLPPYCVPYAYAFRCDPAVLDEMRCNASRQGFDMVNWPELPTEVIGHAPAHYRNVFMVNFLW